MVWCVQFKDDGVWMTLGRYPNELEANKERDEYIKANPGVETKVYAEDDKENP